MSYQLSVDARPVSGGMPLRDRHECTRWPLAGAGLVNYVEHGHTWQWAVIDPAVTPSYLLGLYDVDALANGDRLPIVLEMTCLTSAFQQPAASGTTIDERLVLHPADGVTPPGDRPTSASRTATTRFNVGFIGRRSSRSRGCGCPA